MECKAAGETVFAREVLFEGNCEQAVDTELTLPDYCPDIGRLLKCRLVPMITSRQVNFDSLAVEGTARISVIYLDDRDKKIRCCDRDYPFKASVPYDGGTENVRLLAEARVDYVNCRAVSQRKLDIHGAFTVHMTAVCRKENELVTGVEGEGLRLRMETRAISDLVSCAQTGFDLSEAIELNEGKPPISSIIRSGAVICMEEMQIIPGKLTVRGNAIFTMVYCTEQSEDPSHLVYTIPFNQFFDLPGLDESCMTDIRLCCDALELSLGTDPDGEYRRIDADIRAAADILAYRAERAEWVSDAYSVAYEINCARQPLHMEKLCSTAAETVLWQQTVDTGEYRIDSVCDVWCDVRDSRAVWRDGKTAVTGGMTVGMLLRDSRQGVVYCEKNLRFECAVKQDGQENGEQALRPEVQVTVKSCGGVAAGENKLSVQAELCVHAALYEDIRAEAVSAVETDEKRPKPLDDRPAAVLYFAEPGESLWDIARAYNASAEDIRADNDIAGDTVEESRLLIVTA